MANETVFYTAYPIVDNIVCLDETESAHCVRVLRYKNGDDILLINGIGDIIKGTVADANSKKCVINVSSVNSAPNAGAKLHVAIAPTKQNDRLEWFIEKAVEIGISEITPIICEYSERRKTNPQRLQKILISACKQSLRPWFPTINDEIKFKDFIINNVNHSQKLIAYIDDEPLPHISETIQPGEDLLVIIGPEGDFSPDEINFAKQHGYKLVSLGDARLRTETAALYATATFNIINHK